MKIAGQRMRILVYHATINQHMLAKLCRAVVIVALSAAGLQPLFAAEGKAATTPTNPKRSGQTVLFLTWENVFKGRLEPTIDPARLSDSGRKVLEGLETSWNRRFETNGHGTKMMMAPRGIRISVEKAQKEPLGLKADRPWETRLDSFSILREGPLLKCWYSVHVPKQKEKFLFQNGRAVETGGTAMCYAESTNGFHWAKPNLGVFSFNGSKENNIVSYANFIASVFRDEHGLAEERYKSFEFGKLPADELAKNPGGNMNTYCLYALVSPDGYHWRSLTNNPLIRHFCDTQNVGGWDPLLNKYVGLFRDHQGGRAISRGETDNFHSWPPPQTLLAPGPADDPDVDFYSNGYTTYPGRPSVRLLFAAIYHQAQDRVDTRLAISLEGRSFSWVSREPIIELGKTGEWDSGQVYAVPDLIRLADGRLAMGYSGNRGTHNEGYFPAFYSDYPWPIGFGWAIWGEDRLAGIEAESDGEFYTQSFRPEGERLEINGRASAGGSIRIELCQDAVPVAGYTLADVNALEGDHVWAPVTWKGKPDISELKAKKMQMRVVMKRAKIFGYRITQTKTGGK